MGELSNGISAEFVCKCGQYKGWVTESKHNKTPCPACGRRYRGAYDQKNLTVAAIEIWDSEVR